MKKHLLLILSFLLIGQIGFSQVYLDQMDDDDTSFLGGSGTYSFGEADGELTVTASATGMWDVFTYQPNDAGAASTIDASGNNKIFVRAKASNVGTQLRMDVKDANGYVSSIDGITKTLTTDYMVLEFDFTGGYQDGGFGGTACDAANAPCPVDPTQITELVFFTNPGVGGFNGTVVIDYIAFGEEPATVIMSDVYQNHFDQDSAVGSFDVIGSGYDVIVDAANSEAIITGDGTNPMWDPITYIFRNPTTLDTLDLDISGNNKFYIKVKSTVPGTALRIDVQDIDDFVTTQGSITKIIDTEYAIYEFDFAGTYQDLGFGGTPCTMDTAPCPVDPTRIANLVMFIEPGVGEFIGELTIDYISFGTSLEPPGAQADLVYEDHYNNELVEFTVDAPGFISSEVGTDWIITGDGSATPYSAMAYTLHDKTTDEGILVNMVPGQDKVFVKARTSAGSVPLRLDLVDSTGFVTSQASLTKIVSDEWTIYEYNFSGNYIDGGFGGTACMTGPCAVDETVISTLLFYADPVAGGYDGVIEIDFVSIGQALDDDDMLGPLGAANYQDQMDDNTSLFITDPAGIVSTTVNDEWTMTGDGTGGMWNSINYDPHNDLGEVILVNAEGSGNKIYIRAKASVDMTELRVDLQDNQGYMTNLMAQSVMLGNDYAVYEIDYTGAYLDGAFGGPCMTSGCIVDGLRIQQIQFFINPGVGAYNGTVDIDWISFGSPILSLPPAGVLDYQDQIDETTVNYMEEATGLTVTSDANDIVITGDGTSGMWTPVVYDPHNGTDSIAVNAVGSQDKLFIRAKSTVMDTELRIDLQDYAGFVTNLNSTSDLLSTEFEVYEFDFNGKYADGAFGGTPCTVSGCPVDGERIVALQMFVDPGVGAFNGEINIDWISFGSPIVGVQDLEKIQTLRAFPNPTSDITQVEFDLVKSADVQMNIYNLVGKRMTTIDLGKQTQGLNYQSINMQQFPTGIYVVQIVVEGNSAGTLRLVKE